MINRFFVFLDWMKEAAGLHFNVSSLIKGEEILYVRLIIKSSFLLLAPALALKDNHKRGQQLRWKSRFNSKPYNPTCMVGCYTWRFKNPPWDLLFYFNQILSIANMIGAFRKTQCFDVSRKTQNSTVRFFYLFFNVQSD